MAVGDEDDWQRGGARRCPGETDCDAFEMFTTCDGCPLEAVKREAGWRPSRLTEEAMRIIRLRDAGVTTTAELHSRELLDAVLVLDVALRQAHG